jgi:hypothetical protein
MEDTIGKPLNSLDVPHMHTRQGNWCPQPKSECKIICMTALFSCAIYEVAKITRLHLMFIVAMTEVKYTTASKTCKL